MLCSSRIDLRCCKVSPATSAAIKLSDTSTRVSTVVPPFVNNAISQDDTHSTIELPEPFVLEIATTFYNQAFYTYRSVAFALHLVSGSSTLSNIQARSSRAT